MLDAIAARRSIRKFKNTPVPRHIIEEIIKAGALAPSSKNRQPWHFVVTTGKAKEEALAAMEHGLHREAQQPLLPESAQYIAGAWNTLAIMRQAPVIIFVVNPLGLDLLTPQNAENRVFEICNAQSIGAAVENMSLAAVELPETTYSVLFPSASVNTMAATSLLEDMTGYPVRLSRVILAPSLHIGSTAR